MVHEGGCLCGAVRFKTDGPPINVRVCHCVFCQKAMAAPFFARALFEQTKLKIEGTVERYPTSQYLERTFCPRCGTRIGTWRTNGTAAGIALALFDDRNAFRPTDHIWVSRKMKWLTIEDGLPQFAEGPP